MKVLIAHDSTITELISLTALSRATSGYDVRTPQDVGS